VAALLSLCGITLHAADARTARWQHTRDAMQRDALRHPLQCDRVALVCIAPRPMRVIELNTARCRGRALPDKRRRVRWPA
jgi:hypothetical protein